MVSWPAKHIQVPCPPISITYLMDDWGNGGLGNQPIAQCINTSNVTEYNKAIGTLPACLQGRGGVPELL
jgi:hypothetical protein